MAKLTIERYLEDRRPNSQADFRDRIKYKCSYKIENGWAKAFIRSNGNMVEIPEMDLRLDKNCVFWSLLQNKVAFASVKFDPAEEIYNNFYFRYENLMNA